MKLDQIVSFV